MGTKFAATIITACFLLILFHLVSNRFAVGDVYPSYSSLRSDPIGAKALYDSLEILHRGPRRTYIPLSDFKASNATLLLLGTPYREVPEGRHLLPIATQGNTIVIGLTGRCGATDLPSLDLHIACAGDTPSFRSKTWTVAKGKAFRKFGAGEIIIMQSDPFSNRSLASNRDAGLLADLLERRPIIYFDEHHLGVADPISIGALMQRYRLQSAIAACLILFGLFIWKNATTFLPPIETIESEVSGKDSAAGLANLLRRAIPSSDLIPACIEAWAKSGGNAAKAAQLQSIASACNNPVDAYKAVARSIATKG